MMRILLPLALALPSVAAAVPLQLSNQGYLADDQGLPLDGLHELTFSLYTDGAGTELVWQETLEVTLEDGEYQVILGQQTAIDEDLLSQHPLFLGLAVDGGADMLPRHEVVSAPYAILAETATNVSGGTVDATELKVNGVQVVDSSGNWVGDAPALGDMGCAEGETLAWNEASSVWVCVEASGALASLACADGEIARYDAASSSWICDTDGDFGSSPAASILEQDIQDWDEAWMWGNHAEAGYVTDELDPVFSSSPAGSISGTQISNWNAAFSWGDHRLFSYLTEEADPVYAASAAAGITSGDIDSWNTAAGWGDHAAAGYLTEVDFDSSPAGALTASDVDRWDEAHGWGDHAEAGYVDEVDGVAENLTVTGDLTLDGGTFNFRRYQVSMDDLNIIEFTDWEGNVTTLDAATVADDTTALNAEGTIGLRNAPDGTNSRLYLNIDTGGGSTCMLMHSEDDAPRRVNYATDSGNGYEGVWGNTTTATFIFETEGNSTYAISRWATYVIVCI